MPSVSKRRSGSRVSPAKKSAAISDRALWNAIRSPLRMQLLEAIRSQGPLTIAQLSQLFAAETTGLYYHIRLLSLAGLVSSVQSASVETLQATNGSIALQCTMKNPREAKRARQLIAGLLRESQREFESDQTALGAGMLAGGLRWENLEPSEVAQIRSLQEKIHAIVDGAKARRSKGKDPSKASANWHVGSFIRPARAGQFPMTSISLVNA